MMNSLWNKLIEVTLSNLTLLSSPRHILSEICLIFPVLAIFKGSRSDQFLTFTDGNRRRRPDNVSCLLSRSLFVDYVVVNQYYMKKNDGNFSTECKILNRATIYVFVNCYYNDWVNEVMYTPFFVSQSSLNRIATSKHQI